MTNGREDFTVYKDKELQVLKVETMSPQLLFRIAPGSQSKHTFLTIQEVENLTISLTKWIMSERHVRRPGPKLLAPKEIDPQA